MRKYVETFILFVVGLGPTLIALLLMQQYGTIGISCAIVLSGLYLLCIIIALCCRICLPPPQPDADEEELQSDAAEDLPPSYDIVTSKPPPYYVLFATTPPSGEITHARLFPGASQHRNNLSAVYDVPIHSSSQAVKCYSWIEPCEDKELPSYTDAVAPSSVHLTDTCHPQSSSVHVTATSNRQSSSCHPQSSVHVTATSHPQTSSVHLTDTSQPPE